MTEWDECCGTCRYWMEQDKGGSFPEGDCRRYPPTMPIVCGETQLGIQQWLTSSKHKDTLLPAFPRTYQDEWCGEWKEIPND